MSIALEEAVREQLVDRRRRLLGAIADLGQADDLVRLLRQVDLALDRIGTPDFARCDVCGTSVEDRTLLDHPTTQYCLCELSPRQRDALQRDLDMAQRVQLSLLPPPNLAFAGWEVHSRYIPVGPVSGDFCDVVARSAEPRTLHFCLGDVSGKGVAASLVMARLSALLRGLVEHASPLHEMVGRANRLFSENAIDTHYATVVCGRADETGEVEICNAGHCPPLVVRDGQVTAVDSTGFPVGLIAGDHRYDACRVRLEPGETLVLYSDGLTESFDRDGAQYGQERLCRVLESGRRETPARLTAACLSDVERFRSGAARQDDLTIMVLRRAA